MNKRKRGTGLIIIGLLLIKAAASLAVYNLYEDHMASQSAQQAYAEIRSVQIEPQPQPESVPDLEIPDFMLDPDMDMPVETVDGISYIGVLSIPAIGIDLPVINEWSYPALKKAPCRYAGSVYSHDIVIAAHNYKSHFGKLKDLPDGETIYFTDVDGNVFTYEVTAHELLSKKAVEDMLTGGWDMTLFTCKKGNGAFRLTLRCTLIATTPA